MEVPLPPIILTSVMWGEGEGKHHLAGGAQGGGRSGEQVPGEGAGRRREEREGAYNRLELAKTGRKGSPA